MKSIGLYEAKTRLSALVAELEENGEKIQLTRHGKVVAELCPPAASVCPKRGGLKSKDFHMAENFDESEVGFEDFFGGKPMRGGIKAAGDEQKYSAD